MVTFHCPRCGEVAPHDIRRWVSTQWVDDTRWKSLIHVRCRKCQVVETTYRLYTLPEGTTRADLKSKKR
jgi:predicted RNA-binding Zn-ribbon protein involved in translation (DUF1610 family)